MPLRALGWAAVRPPDVSERVVEVGVLRVCLEGRLRFLLPPGLRRRELLGARLGAAHAVAV